LALRVSWAAVSWALVSWVSGLSVSIRRSNRRNP
jgi:hypothetical protein